MRIDAGRPLVIGDEGSWQVKIAAAEKATVEVRASAGAAVRVNEVEVRNVALARAGDVIALPDRSLLVQRVTAPGLAPFLVASHEAFQQRVIEETKRAELGRAGVSLLLVRSRALLAEGIYEFLRAPEVEGLRTRGRMPLVGHAAPGTLELLCLGATIFEADELREQFSEALGRLGRPFRWGWASAPTEALDAATLWGRALDRFFGDFSEAADDFPHVDPVMARLWTFCDVWAEMDGGVLVEGEVGSGRESLGRVIHERKAADAPFVVARSASFDDALWRSAVERAHGGTLYVRHIEALPPRLRSSFWDASAFRPMAGIQGDLPIHCPRVVIAVPPLRDRPLDVLPIAEHVLARCTSPERTRKLKLTLSARSTLSREWTGSVRELKNSVQLAALLVDPSGEVLPEHLVSSQARVPGLKPGETDLRTSLRSVERRSFLEALARTNWNVTEAARTLGLPRRTLVYRMSRLGLKRPASSG